MIDDIFATMACAVPGKDKTDCIEDMPLAMSYVPIQKWKEIYDTDAGFERGTIFAALDKPFLGRRPLND